MKIIIYGAGGNGKEIVDLYYAINENYDSDSIVFIDDFRSETHFYNCPMFTFQNIEKFNKDEYHFVIAIGEVKARTLLYNKMIAHGFKPASLIHPDVFISNSANIGEGFVARKGCFISSNAKIGENVNLQHYVVIGHDSIIGKNCQISSFTDIAGGVSIGNDVFVGLNAMVKEKLVIGNNCIISMGSIVMQSIQDNLVVMGNPARVIKYSDGKVFK